MAFRIRRGPTADRETVTFLEGELIYDTDEKAVYIGDGAEPGGLPVTSFTAEDAQDAAAALFLNGNPDHANISFAYNDTSNKIVATVTLDGIGITEVLEDTSPQLGGNLDLNSFKITGAGNIETTGDVTIIGDVSATEFSGPLIGNVSGDLTGNVDGNVVGNVEGDLTGDVYAADGTSKILENGTDGTDAAFTGSVTGDVTTASITAPVGSDVVFNSNAQFDQTLTVVGESVLAAATFEADISLQSPQEPLVTISITDNNVNTTPVAINLVTAAQATLSSGNTIQFSVADSLNDPAGDPGKPIARLVGLADTNSGGFEIRVWDPVASDFVVQYSTVQDLTIINNKVSILGRSIFTHGLEDIPEGISDSSNLTLYPDGNIVTYGNLLPGVEDDGLGNPVPSGTYNIGANSTRYKDLYLNGMTLTSVPAASIGATGDVTGMVAFDSTYIYYCTADYDGVTSIWTRATLSYSTW